MTIKFYITLIFLFCTANIVPAQNISPCATPPIKSDWLKAYQKSPNKYAKGGDTTLFVPITIHVLGSDNGGGYLDVPIILEGFCQLNEDFGESNIQFFIEGDFNYINNSIWYGHDNLTLGYEMMTANNIPNTINIYIVGTAAGSAGYNLPSANAISMLKSYIGEDIHTWAHEIGHNLSVQHPFLGWEGNSYNFNQQTPTEVYYDYTAFKEIFYTDTTIIDTALVEYVARTNCYEAGDGFCDTPPDYLASGFVCNAKGQSTTLQKDPDGEVFYSDGRNYMSYAADACNAYFTPEQMAAMRANLLDEKPDYLYNPNPPHAAVTASPTLISPIGGAIIPINATQLTWAAAPNATHYYYEINRLSNFSPSFRVASGVTDALSIEVENLNLNSTYYWRIFPYSLGNTCSSFTEGASFVVGDAVGFEALEGFESLDVYPNILSKNQPLQFDIQTNKSLSFTANLYAANGQFVQPLFEGSVIGNTLKRIDLKPLAAGVYFVGIQSNSYVDYRKIIVTN